MKRIAILGAGMSGLILCEALEQNNKDIKIDIYTKDILGQQKYSFDLGPRILHSTEKVDKFIKNFLGETNKRKYKIGYLIDKNLVDECEKENVKKYAEKCGKMLSESTMSCGKNEITGYDIRGLQIAEKLAEKHKDKITACTVDKALLKRLKDDYDKIYSTIPLGVLQEILGYQNSTLVSSSIFVLSKEEYKYNPYDYVYDLSDDNAVKRISNFKGKSVYELVGTYKDIVEEALKISDGVGIEEMHIVKSTIVMNFPLRHFAGIELVGRFATNNHSERLDTIIEKYLR